MKDVFEFVGILYYKKNSSTTLHRRNLQKLMTKIFKIKDRMDQELIKDVLNLLIYFLI